jgi:hypothetical protein
VDYVERILDRFEHYKAFVPAEPSTEEVPQIIVEPATATQ